MVRGRHGLCQEVSRAPHLAGGRPRGAPDAGAVTREGRETRLAEAAPAESGDRDQSGDVRWSSVAMTGVTGRGRRAGTERLGRPPGGEDLAHRDRVLDRGEHAQPPPTAGAG